MRTVGIVVFSLALCAAPAPAAADTIYLRNGRTIDTAWARIEGDRVVFSQFDGTVSIPRSQVLRIVENERIESRRETPATPPSPPPATDAAADEDAAPTNPWFTSGYWIEQIRAVDVDIARIQRELDRLPEYSETDQRLFRYSGQIRYFVDERAKWERLMETFQLHRKRLLNAARKAGITPGDLRDGLR